MPRDIPQRIYDSPKQRQPPIVLPRLKLTKLARDGLLYGLIAFLLMIVGYAFLNFDTDNWIAFFNGPLLVPVVLALVMISFMWQWIANAEIVPNTNVHRKNHKATEKANKATIVFSFASHLLSMAFVLWMMIWLIVAGMNEEHVLVQHYNEFGEYQLELFLGLGMTVVIVIGLYLRFRRFRGEMLIH